MRAMAVSPDSTRTGTVGALQRRVSLVWPRAVSLLMGTALSGCGATEAEPFDEAFPSRRRQIDSTGVTLGYVANELSDSISVLDLDRNTEIARMPVGVDPVELDGPRNILLARERGVAYVMLGYPLRTSPTHDEGSSEEHPGFVQVLALADLAPVAVLDLQAHPSALALSEDAGELAVLYRDSTEAGVQGTLERNDADVLFVDLDSLGAAPSPMMRQTPICIVPVAALYGKSGRLYVACSGEDTVVVMDPDLGTVVESLSVGETRAEQPGALALDSSGSRLVVSNRVTRESVVFRVGEPSIVVNRTILPGVPGRAAWLGEDEYVVPVRDPAGVVVVGASDGVIRRQSSFDESDCSVPTSATALPDGRAFLVCTGDGYEDGHIAELDPTTLALERSIAVGRQPDGLEVRLP